eukprot:936754-Rhodomonas_salina.10
MLLPGAVYRRPCVCRRSDSLYAAGSAGGDAIIYGCGHAVYGGDDAIYGSDATIHGSDHAIYRGDDTIYGGGHTVYGGGIYGGGTVMYAGNTSNYGGSTQPVMKAVLSFMMAILSFMEAVLPFVEATLTFLEAKLTFLGGRPQPQTVRQTRTVGDLRWAMLSAYALAVRVRYCRNEAYGALRRTELRARSCSVWWYAICGTEVAYGAM